MSDDNTPPLKLEVTNDQIKGFVAEAILHQLDDATRQEMITSALKHLISDGKKKNSWEKDIPSPLEEAYNRAVGHTANGIVGELIRGEFKERIEAVVREALEKVFTENREKLVEGIAHSMQLAMYSLHDG